MSNDRGSENLLSLIIYSIAEFTRPNFIGLKQIKAVNVPSNYLSLSLEWSFKYLLKSDQVCRNELSNFSNLFLIKNILRNNSKHNKKKSLNLFQKQSLCFKIVVEPKNRYLEKKFSYAFKT